MISRIQSQNISAKGAIIINPVVYGWGVPDINNNSTEGAKSINEKIIDFAPLGAIIGIHVQYPDGTVRAIDFHAFGA